MAITFKNRKLRKNKNTIKKPYNNLRGGKNFIDVLFNIGDSEEDSSCQVSKKSGSDSNSVDHSEEDKIIKSQVDSSNNILEKWIKHTDENNGMTLYFVTENIENDNQETQQNEKWLSGFHGAALNNRYKIKFNEYLKEKLEETDNSLFKNCLEGDDKNSNKDCQESLNIIQTSDIKNITKRVSMNNTVNDFLLKWMDSSKSVLQDKEKEMKQKIEEMQRDLEEQKQKMDTHKNNIQKLISKNINYNKIIREYISSDPDYEKLQNIDSSTFEIPDDLIKYISISLQNHDNGDVNKDLNF